MSGTSEPTEEDDRKRFRTTIEVEPADGGAWKAFEPASDGDLYGRGETPPEAVQNYALALQSDNVVEAPADD